jgi:hypothetical protein
VPGIGDCWAILLNVKKLEEHYLALVDKLHMVQHEISTLHTKLTNVRSGKHHAETKRAAEQEDSRVAG